MSQAGIVKNKVAPTAKLDKKAAAHRASKPRQGIKRIEVWSCQGDCEYQLMGSAPATPNPPTVPLPSKIIPESHCAQILQLRANLVAQQQVTDTLQVKLDDLTQLPATMPSFDTTIL
ncbi:hypothetical protein JAAARDRAFT_47131 [Jaapia argillacea MUCL 33604]|uniref:Uncharacterized protein n=1 Tax=Jaapia argillacea MUCL 33604 TaxID=933084 RepID=A0A067PVP6_9AGAM|nr:hypothetical protein JAAARDRAFT_47131 [Jaapia argillacea MUCL 33604]